MKPIVVLFAIIAVALAVPRRPVPFWRNEPQKVSIVREIPSDNIGLDGYQFAYEQSDGQIREESAQVETRSAEESILRVRGSFSWVDPATGQTYTVTYIADENGFQPQGAHLPVAPIA